MAERQGFEPWIPLQYTHFPSVRLKPLGHLSRLYISLILLKLHLIYLFVLINYINIFKYENFLHFYL